MSGANEYEHFERCPTCSGGRPFECERGRRLIEGASNRLNRLLVGALVVDADDVEGES